MSIEVKNVSKVFRRKKVLDNISLTLKPVGIYGLLGANSAGKSTLINIINDRLNYQQGTVTLNGQNVHNNDKALTNFYLMNGDHLYPGSMKIKQLFKLSRNFYGDFDQSLSQRLVKRFQIDTTKTLKSLSTGTYQIVMIIVSLSLPAKYVFLDEPVSGLDATNRSIFYEELIQTYIDRPRCFIITTHLINELEKLFSHLILIDHNKVKINDNIESVQGLSHQIVGPQKDVEAYTHGLNVIGSDRFANTFTQYVYDALDEDRVLPDTVSIEPLSVQDLFIHLTDQGEGL